MYFNKFKYFAFASILTTTINVSAQHSHGVEEVIVTADPLSAVDNHLIQPVQVLTREDLRKRNTSNIGEALANEPGVSSADFGPGAGRPIIRGMGGSRVKILENGISTMDVSTLSADHAVTTEPVFARQIEILRGPATLLYGSGASGGLVNVVNDRILKYVPENLEGELSFDYDTATEGVTGAANINVGTGEFAFHLDAMVRDTDDYDIPGFAEAEPDEPEQGTLENSSVETDSFGIGASYIGERGFIGFAVSQTSSDYGVPGGHHHEEEEGEEEEEEEEGGVTIDMEQTRYDLEAALNQPVPGLRQIKTRWAYNDYEHDEVEGSGEVGTRFNNEEVEGRVEFIHDTFGNGNWDGVFGIQYRDVDFSAVGEEGFVPPSSLDSIAVFIVEKADFGAWHVELGARYESQDAETNAGVEAEHDSYSLSGGANWEYQDGYKLGISLTHSQRAPNIEELFANGPHLATGTFEIGDPNLDEETSTNIDLYWHKTTGQVTFAANFFYNQVDDFIFLAEQDLNGDGIADRVEEDFDGDPADILDPDEDEEPLLVQQTQEDADFWGFEFQTVVRMFDDNRGTLDARLWADYVQAERDNNVNLPRITPWRFGAGLDYLRGPWYASLDYTRASEQDDTAPLETTTDGYDMLNVHVAYNFKFADTNMSLFVRGSNLFDEEIRRHTSFVKDLAPLPGRSGTFGIRASF